MSELNEKKKYSLRFGNKDLPSFLVTKENIRKLIFFTTVYSLVFINIFRPFNSETWIPGINSFNYFLYSSLMVVIGLALISLSRLIMHYFVKKISIGYLEYLIWILGEITILAGFYVFIAHKVGFITNFIAENPNITYWEAIFEIFRKAIANTTWMLLIPYIISFLYLYNEHLLRKVIKEKDDIIEEEINNKQIVLKSLNEEKNKSAKLAKELEQEQDNIINLENELEKERKIILELQNNLEEEKRKENGEGNNVIQFKDERNEVRFTLSLEKIIFIESSDNYCSIKYLNKNEISDFLLRNSLKKLSEELKDTPLQRCHRSYMINFEHVASLRRDNNEISLEFDVKGIKEIPVSRSYNDKIMELFVKFSKQKFHI